ncbi:aspergillopepsin-F [Magnaporthiopsis poae ATCC 64411]|uniref:Aspergillopepsin-F n=1 Tax=Magnaporthiopsis poae (strain ATCC 64411 / 73-15) TaxID=644358 RepID=A0A0C4DNF3_MAGP6|nr:aspergillopepsin-F [Magnaporthiopsis poae ATCC 64411]
MWSLLNSLLFLGLLASFVSAAPARLQKRSFKVERVRNVNFKGYNGRRELLKAYSKYSMPIPDSLLESIRAEAAAAKAAEAAAVAATSVNAEAADAVSAEAVETVKAGDIILGGIEFIPASPQGAPAAPGQAPAVIPNPRSIFTARERVTVYWGQRRPSAGPGDVEYLSPVNIGGQTLNLDFDSGSSDLWVFSTLLARTTQRGHVVYDPSKSTSFKMLQGASFQISYGDGSQAAGLVGTDTVDIGGVSVANQAVELATQVSGSFVQDTANNGLVGLAFSNINAVKPEKQKTFFDNVMSSLAEPLFTADLRKGAVGAYEFGRIDTSKFTGPMNFVPINATKGFWQFTSDKFAVGDGQPQPSTPGAQAIADTGTTLILADKAVVEAYYSQVPGAKNDQAAGGITIPCDAAMPDLKLDVGGVMAKVRGSDIVFAKVENNTCFGGMQVSTNSVQIYGDIFFKSQFVVFNGGNKTLGVADHAV